MSMENGRLIWIIRKVHDVGGSLGTDTIMLYDINTKKTGKIHGAHSYIVDGDKLYYLTYPENRVDKADLWVTGSKP